jgi:hypothetical protein
MSQQDLVRLLHGQGQSATEIHCCLLATFGPLCISYSTVARTIRALSWTPANEATHDLGGRPANPSIDALIQKCLAENPEASIREIATETGIPSSTVWYVLTTRLGYIWRKCRLVAHSLTAQQQEQRLLQSRALLKMLQKAKAHAWRYLSTGDESWFFYYTPHQKLWLPQDVEAPAVARRLIDTPKLMVTIFWGASGIHVITFLPPGTSFNSTYFEDQVLSQFISLPVVQEARARKKAFVVHMDNSPVHRSKSVMTKIAGMPIQLAPHPPYSPDLAPSDFFLFGHLKCQSMGIEFDGAEDLMEWIKAAFERISKATIEKVFDEWMERLQRCIAVEGAYFSEE